MATIDLPYGHKQLLITIPDEWLGEVAAPRPVAPAVDVAGLVRDAIRQPIGCRPLAQIVAPGQRVAILVDDATRKTPASQILPLLLDELQAAGVRQADICLVVALGTHRPMTQAELVAKLGEEAAHHYRVVNVPSTDDSQMAYLGTSSNGIPAWVNRCVVEAEVRIGLGMVTPHMDAGFSGGAKIILPGVCSSRTVDAFHAASAFIPENQLGMLSAPLRCSLEQFVAEKVPLHFIVNIILTLDGQVYQCVAGHSVHAQRAGVRYAIEVFSTPIRRRFPVVVANCYPYDMDWWQSAKGVWAGDLMTADGGTLVIVTAAEEGTGGYSLLPGYIGRDAEEIKGEIERGTAQDAKQAATGAMYGTLRRRINLALCSAGITPAEAEAMRMPYFASVEHAVGEAVTGLAEEDRAGSVGVLTHAGIVLPLL